MKAANEAMLEVAVDAAGAGHDLDGFEPEKMPTIRSKDIRQDVESAAVQHGLGKMGRCIACWGIAAREESRVGTGILIYGRVGSCLIDKSHVWGVTNVISALDRLSKLPDS